MTRDETIAINDVPITKYRVDSFHCFSECRAFVCIKTKKTILSDNRVWFHNWKSIVKYLVFFINTYSLRFWSRFFPAILFFSLWLREVGRPMWKFLIQIFMYYGLKSYILLKREAVLNLKVINKNQDRFAIFLFSNV